MSTPSYPTYIITQEPGMVPLRKGPFYGTKMVEGFLLEAYRHDPSIVCIVIDMGNEDNTWYPEHGYAWLDINGDGRKRHPRKNRLKQAPLTNFESELAAAKRRIAELEAERQWQPIETAPKDSSVILGVTITEGGETWSHVAQGKWIDGEEDQVDQPGRDAGFVDNEYCCFHPGRSFGPEKYQYSGLQPTHWMPLPASPHEGTQS